jgi:hypothetical protein
MTNHLTILKNPWYEWLITGQKPIESRVSIHKIDPYCRVHKGDVIYLKKSGNPKIQHKTTVDHVEFYAGALVKKALVKHQAGIRIDDAYIQAKAKAQYCSLIWVGKIEIIPPIIYHHTGQQAWIMDPKLQVTLQ